MTEGMLAETLHKDCRASQDCRNFRLGRSLPGNQNLIMIHGGAASSHGPLLSHIKVLYSQTSANTACVTILR